MTRYIYGADGSAQVVSMAGTPTTANATVKTTRTGGTTVTDVQKIDGTPLAGIVTPDAHGQIVFQGPDNSTATYWLDFGDGGPRWAVRPTDFQTASTVLRAALMASEYAAPGGHTAKAQLPYTPNSVSQALATALEGIVIPRFADATARNAAYPTPSDGDRVYRTDLHAHQTYRTLLGSGTGRWVTDNALIGEMVLSADSSGFSFLAIPQDWRHLQIKYTTRIVGSTASGTYASYFGLRFNSDTAGNYAYHGDVRTVVPNAGSYTSAYEIARNATSGTTGANGPGVTGTSFGNTTGGLTNFVGVGISACYLGIVPGSSLTIMGGGEIEINNYNLSTVRKSFRGRSSFGDAGGATGVGYQARSILSGGWSNNAAITQIDVIPSNGTGFAAGSVFSLYGLS